MGNVKSLRGYFPFSTWVQIISSEVSFDSSEVSFRPYVENVFSPRGDFEIPPWRISASREYDSENHEPTKVTQDMKTTS